MVEKKPSKQMKISDNRAYMVLHVLLVVVLFAALVGMVLLLSQAQSMEMAIFELTAFTVSIIAVVLAVLGMITGMHQVQTVRQISKDIRGTLRELKELDRDNEVIKRKLNQDYALSQDIAEALAEAGIIEGDDKRRMAARKIEHKIRKRV